MFVAFENLVAHAHQHRSTCILTQGVDKAQKFLLSPMASTTISNSLRHDYTTCIVKPWFNGSTFHVFPHLVHFLAQAEDPYT